MSSKGNPRRLSWFLLALLVFSSCILAGAGKKDKGKEDKTSDAPKKKKDIRDYSDADMERLFMEWEEAEDEHDPDDLLEHERPGPAIDLSQIDPSNPESALKLTKKGKTLMLFVSVSGSPSQEETETITNRWQTMLFNANYQFQRYPVSSDRVIFLLKDGSLAWEIKDFLILQDRCQEVSIDGQIFAGKGSGAKVDPKGKVVGLDDDAGAGKGARKTKPAKTKKKKPTADKPKRGESEESKGKKKPAKTKSTAERTGVKKDIAKTGKPSTDQSGEQSSDGSPRRDAKEEQNANRESPVNVPQDDPDHSDDSGTAENTFFRQADDPDHDTGAAKRDEPGYHAERAKKAREKRGSYKSAVPLIIPSDFIDDSDSPTETEKKDEL